MSERGLIAASAIAFVLGVGLIIPFQQPITLAVGVLCLFACIVFGVFGLLTPRRLAQHQPNGSPEVE